MIGQWQRFGEGPLPDDGEAIIVIQATSWFEKVNGLPGRVVPVIHRAGTLFEQDGASYPIPYGYLWTSLPPGPGIGDGTNPPQPAPLRA